MDKNLYAIQRPDRTIIQDSLSDRIGTAWVNALASVEDGNALMDNKRTLDTWSDVGERLGYRCVEVEVVKAGGRVCEWTEDTEGTFVTSCGNYFQFTADGPKENKFQFCPYCGGKIVEAEDGKKEVKP